MSSQVCVPVLVLVLVFEKRAGSCAVALQQAADAVLRVHGIFCAL